MERKHKSIIIASQKWNLQSLFPADFLREKFWPFSFYRLPEDLQEKNQSPKYDWKLKPKSMVDMEADMQAAVRQAIQVGACLKFGQYPEIEKDESLKNGLLAEIYALTYGLSLEQKLFVPFETIRRENAEMIYFKAKAYNQEPFGQVANLQDEAPEIYNPRRYDFNLFILGCGWDRERREAEKAQAAMKAKQFLPRKR